MEYNYNEQFRGKEIALKILQLKAAIRILETEYKEKDPCFLISPMYNYARVGRKLVFATTPKCNSVELERRMKEIARQICQ